MHKNTKFISTGLMALTALSASVIHADESTQKDSPRLGVGLALVDLGQPYDTDEALGGVALFLEYHGERINVDYDHISYSVLKNENLTFDVLGQVRFLGYEADDDKIFKGMEDRDLAFEIGGKLSLHNSLGTVSLALLADPDTAHEGHAAYLEVDKKFQAGAWTLNPTVGVNWQSDKVTDYYYGVRNSEATATRAAFKGKDAVIPYVDFDASRKFGENWKVGLMLNYKYYPDEVTDSPLVKDEHIISAGARASYFF
ncbi:MAG TPA: MipA/OmpV family protein [Chromatiales bacterium]|nr:MipA/OmpV family protein [Thiotrichales bacterium]HIP67078.1 MipA/OmpV family protein [Chromatiales bacterium]